MSFGLIQRHKLNIPVVVSIQGNITVYDYMYYNGVPKLFVNRNTSIFKTITNQNFNHGKRIFELKKEREEEILKLSKHIIGRTDWDKRITRILAPESNYYHNDEILRPIFYNNKWKNPDNILFTIYTTNGDTIYKGFETILKAVELLEKNDVDFVWKIGGLKKDSQIVNLSTKMLNIDVSDKIQFLGSLSEKEIAENLMSSNLYVMPSHIENSPNNLAEAQIIGVPCIATHAGGTDSLLKDKETGYLIQDGDPWMLAGTILEAMNDYNESYKLAINAREVALQRHNPKRIVDSLINIYNQVMAES